MVGATRSGAFTLRVAVAAVGRVYWVVVDGGAPGTEPTRAEVTAGTAAGAYTRPSFSSTRALCMG